MASLENPRWETVSPELRRVLEIISQQRFAQRIYLAGGTALALQIGHRRSIDLDFFSEDDEFLDASRHEIISSLERVAEVEVREDVIGNLLLRVNNISAGFFSYGHPLLERVELPTPFVLASITDIGLMKMDAIVTRGARKDFIDLHFVLRRISMDTLLAMRPVKYPRARNFEMMLLEGLTNHDNSEQDPMPDMLMPVDWSEVKAEFIAEAHRLGEKWLGIT